MPSIFWAGKQTHFPPLAFSQPVAIAKPLSVACSGFASFTKSCLPSALKSHLFRIALTDSALIIPIVPVPSGFPTCTPILAPRCCMELEPLRGCFLDYTVTVLFHLSYFISSRITANASRAEIYIFVSLWYFPVVFCAQLILRKVRLLLVSVTGHLLIPLICIFTGSPSVLTAHMFVLLTIIKCLFKCSCWEVTPALQTFLSLEQRIIISHIPTLCEQNFMWHPGFQNECSC